jgi:HEAT repeat protein
MKRFSKIITVFLTLLAISMGGISHSQDTSVPDSIKKQIEYLKRGSSKQKIETARALGNMGADAVPAVPYLIELLGTSLKYKNIWNRVWNTITIFSNSGFSVAWESRQALIKIGNPAVGQLSYALTNHLKVPVRFHVALALGEIKDVTSVDALITALQKDIDPKVRMVAAEALGKMAEKWSSDLLSDASTALIKSLKDNDEDVRQKAAWALGKIKPMKAIPALIDAMRIYGKDSNAESALTSITGQRFDDDPQKWQEWWDVNKE